MSNPRKLETVGDLRDLLKHVPDDAPLRVAATPDMDPVFNKVLGCSSMDGETVVLGLAEKAEEPQHLGVWVTPGGQQVRPC